MWLEFRWWGVIVHLTREAACLAITGSPNFEQPLNEVPEPWRTFIRAAIAAYSWTIGDRIGVDGVDIHLNWFGFVHWIGPSGAPQPG
jgi:hypothetical protein